MSSPRNGFIRCAFASLLCLLATGAPTPASPSQSKLTLQADEGHLTVRCEGKPLLVYACAANQFKPYVRELYTLKGDNVLLDAPADHLHHHGLMFAIHINGVNFWEERGEAGHQKVIQMLDRGVATSSEGLPQAFFTDLLHWVAQKDRDLPDTAGAALLVERRTIRVTVDASHEEVALHWHSDFEAGPAAPKVTLSGSAYNGLGLRPVPAFDHVARRLNSQDAGYTAEARFDVTACAWEALIGKVEDRTITLALFDHPANRGEPRFFSMLNVFAYLAATQGLDKSPLEYARGEKFSLDYLLAVHAGAREKNALDARYRVWEKVSTPGNKPGDRSQ